MGGVFSLLALLIPQPRRRKAADLGCVFCFVFSFLKKILFIFRQRGREGKREEEKHQCVVDCQAHPTGDLAHNPGMCRRLGIEPVILWFSGWHSVH